MRKGVLGLLVSGALLLAPAGAHAGTATYARGGLTFVAADGERNVVDVRRPAGGAFVLTDTGAPVTAGAGCLSLSSQQVRCPGLSFLDDCPVGTGGCLPDRVDLGDGDDRAVVAGGPRGATVLGGGGNDRLEGSTVALRLDGGDGDDALLGSSGDDTLVGGAGADLLDGRDGTDTADYSGRADGVTVSLGGGADDGAPGEGDDVRTENVTGGPGADRLTGDGAANRIAGGGGRDALSGGGGADLLVSEGADADGRGSTVRCGTGADRTRAQQRETISVDCEATGFGQEPYEAVRVDRRTVRAGRRGTVRLRLRRLPPPRPAGFAGPLVEEALRVGTVALHAGDGRTRSSRASYRLGTDQVLKVAVRLNAATRRRLAGARGRRITLYVVRTARLQRADQARPKAGSLLLLSTAVRILAPRRR